MNKFEKQKIEVICSHAYELCKEGKLSYEEFASMSLEDLAKKLDSIHRMESAIHNTPTEQGNITTERLYTPTSAFNRISFK